jgi:hypothetical protein
MVGLDPTIRSLHELFGAAQDGRIKSDHDGVDIATVVHQVGWRQGSRTAA